MKNKLAVAISIAMISLSSADYRVKVFLDPSVNIEAPDSITGDINLSPSKINRGESSSLEWSYEFLTELSVSGGLDYETSNKSGSFSLNPLRTTQYNVFVDNGKATKNKTLTLEVEQPDPVITFNSNTYKIGEGQSATLNWNVTNVDSVSISNIGAVNSTDSLSVSPVNDTTYTLNAVGYYGEKKDNKSLTIDVVKNSLINSFTVNNNKFTVGESAIFSWNVNDSEGLTLDPIGEIDSSKTNTNVLLSTIGNFDYTLNTTSFNGSKKSSTLTIDVYGEPIINSYTVNGEKSVNVEIGDDLNFAWNQSNGQTVKLENQVVSGSSTVLKATETKDYLLSVINGASKSIIDNVKVTVVDVAKILTFTGPTAVFNNSPIVLNWTGTGVTEYTLSSSNGSGITSENLGTTLTKTLTPTSVGNFTYKLSAKNLANKSVETTKNVSVENNPTFTSMSVNGQQSVTVSPNASLVYAAVGASSGATLVGRDSSNTNNVTNPATAPTTAGSYTYYGAVAKSLNSVTRNSAVQSVNVTVVNDPTIGTVTAPTNVFANTTFAMSWNGTNVTNYKIKANSAAAGVSTSDIDLGTSVNTNITPTNSGTYIYTITATNAAGVSTTSSKTIVVEADPTFDTFTVNGSTSIIVAPSVALTYAYTGNSAGSTFEGRNSSNNGTVTNPASSSATAGTYTYYGSVVKTLNGVNRTSSARSVSVKVVNNPTVGTITAPTTVFANAGFTLSWTGANISSYKIKANSASSGISTSDIDLGTATSRTVTPTSAGTYTYTITGVNEAGITSSQTVNVVVEADPTFTSFTINGSTAITVAPSASLTYAIAGNSAGSSYVARNAANTTDVNNTAIAPGVGSYTFYAAVTKTLNGVARYSAVRGVNITVVANPTVDAISAATPINLGSAFTLSWSGTGVTSYTVSANTYSGSGLSSATNVGTATSRAITPTVAGTYTYTVTGGNAAGINASRSASVKVESWSATSSTYTAWANSGATYNCSAWTPDVSTVNAGTSFPQTRTCSQNQTRSRQDRQVEAATGAIRNNGTAVTESQTISVGESQTAVGTLSACRNDGKNFWQTVPMSGGIAGNSIYWDGTQRYVGTSANANLMSVKASDGSTYYRTTGGMGNFAVCKQ